MLEDLAEHFRDRRPIVIFLVVFTLIGGVVAGIICVNNGVCDFGTAYEFSLGVGTLLTICILGYSRFAGAFKWVSELVPESPFDYRYPNPLAVIGLIGWLILIVVVPMIECFLLPVDIIATIVVSVIDVVGAVHGVKYCDDNEPSNETKELIDSVEEAVSAEESKRDILKISELTEEETQILCQMVKEVAERCLQLDFGRKKRLYTYLGSIILTKSGRNLRLYIVYRVTVPKVRINDFIYAMYFENLCRKSDGTLDFKDGHAMSDCAWHDVLRFKDKSVLDAYTSLKAFCAILPTDCERDSNFIDF